MLKAIWSKLKENLSDSDPFVTFIQVAKETPEIRNTLTAILKENDFNRESILNTYIEEMRFKGAPASFVASLSRLLDKEVARRALELLNEDPKQTPHHERAAQSLAPREHKIARSTKRRANSKSQAPNSK